MQIAEQTMGNMDMKGAQKLAMRAQKLFPMLEGLEKMSAVIQSCLVSENKINGEPDWYRFLGVDPVSAGADVAIKQQYRRKLLLLHPDKNKFPGASEAFEILSSAWSVLSDKDKKREYNKKLNIQSPKKSFVTGESGSGGRTETAGGSEMKPTRKRKGRKFEDAQVVRKAAANWINQLKALRPQGSGAP